VLQAKLNIQAVSFREKYSYSLTEQTIRNEKPHLTSVIENKHTKKKS